MTTMAQPEEAVMQRDRQAWNARTLLGRRTWKQELPDEVRAEFAAFRAANEGLADDVAGFEFDPERLPALAAFADHTRLELLEGDGVSWTYGLDTMGLGEAWQRLFYVAFGAAMGSPMTQYGVLYPVRDRGVDYRQSAVPVSMTKEETGFHTDSSSRDVIPDFVGLLCETPSEHGGESLVSNALHVHRQIKKIAPAVLEILQQEFLRDVVTPGIEKSEENLRRNRFPIYARCDRPEGLVFRYMRYWIEKGHERAEQPLDAVQVAALDTLDRFLADPENVVSFRLQAGDILWVNNRTVAHNRTGYRDSEENVRQLQRMWIQARR